MNQKSLLFFSLLFFSSFSSTPLAQLSPSPALAPASPKPPAKPAPAAPAPAPAKPLVPAAPQSPVVGDTPDSSTDDIIKILRKAKSYNFLIRLLKTTQIINQINSQLITTKTGGLTILAPTDNAFNDLKAGFLNSLDDNQKIELLQFHVLPVYVSSSNFDSLTNPVRTLAGDKPSRLQLNVTAYGNMVNISTGVVNTTISGIVYTDKSLAIYRLDKVLLPLDFFKPKAAPAAAPLEAAKAPKADKENPAEGGGGADDESETAKDKSGVDNGLVGVSVITVGVSLVAVAMAL